MKEYMLRLLLSEPSLLGDFKRYGLGIKENELVDYLIVETIVDPSNPTSLLDSAFSALDRLLLDTTTSALIEYTLGLNTRNEFLSSLS